MKNHQLDLGSANCGVFNMNFAGSGENDKVAEILLRGRDHGLPSYAAWRRFCALKPVNNFTDLSDYVSSANIALLSSIYA